MARIGRGFPAAHYVKTTSVVGATSTSPQTPLVHYFGTVNFPGGGTPANYPVSVINRGGNQLTLLFTDQAGTTPQPNPITTDGFGMVSFYAAPGDYIIPLAGDIFSVMVASSHTDPVWPDLWVHDQSTPAAVWTITHHFGVQPQVEILIAGQVTQASSITHPDNETTTITFAAPTAGVAYLRR